MIGSTRNVRVFAYTEPADLRRSYDGLFAIATEEMKHDVLAGDLYLFVNKRRNRAKVLLFDGTGLCIYMKRMDKGHFAAPWRSVLCGVARRKSSAGLYQALHLAARSLWQVRNVHV